MSDAIDSAEAMSGADDRCKAAVDSVEARACCVARPYAHRKATMEARCGHVDGRSQSSWQHIARFDQREDWRSPSHHPGRFGGCGAQQHPSRSSPPLLTGQLAARGPTLVPTLGPMDTSFFGHLPLSTTLQPTEWLTPNIAKEPPPP